MDVWLNDDISRAGTYASGVPMTASTGREHFENVNALRCLQEPEFTSVVRKTLTGFAARWLSTMSAS